MTRDKFYEKLKANNISRKEFFTNLLGKKTDCISRYGKYGEIPKLYDRILELYIFKKKYDILQEILVRKDTE